MKNPRILTIVAAATLLASTGAYAQPEKEEAAIKYRQSVMSSIGGHFGAIFGIARGDVDHAAHLGAHAAALSDLTTMIVDAFLTRTEGGETRAKPEIWNDFAGFVRHARETQAAAVALAVLVDEGTEPDELIEPVKVVLDSCKACHKDYREKKKE